SVAARRRKARACSGRDRSPPVHAGAPCDGAALVLAELARILAQRLELGCHSLQPYPTLARIHPGGGDTEAGKADAGEGGAELPSAASSALRRAASRYSGWTSRNRFCRSRIS